MTCFGVLPKVGEDNTCDRERFKIQLTLDAGRRGFLWTGDKFSWIGQSFRMRAEV
jgi:hypothetical protein